MPPSDILPLKLLKCASTIQVLILMRPIGDIGIENTDKMRCADITLMPECNY